MNEKIFMIDDDQSLLNFYKDSLESTFKVFAVSDGKEGLKILKEHSSDPFPVIVSDYVMPEMNGIEFLIGAKQIIPDSVRIMLTSTNDVHVASEALADGNIFRFLTKPCPPEILEKNILAGIDQYHLITAEKTLLEKTLLGSIGIVVEILSVVNPEAFAQTIRMRNLVKKMIARLKMKNIWEIEIGVLLSQIGCVAIPEDILLKYFHGHELSEKESQMFYSHPLSGYKFISKIPRLEKIADGVLKQFKVYEKGSESLNIISQFIKVLFDYDTLILSGKFPKVALEIMHANEEKYNSLILQALEAEVLHVMDGFIVKTIKLEELSVGMVLADDIISERNVVLVRKNNEISDVILDKIMNFRFFEPLQEPLKILEPIS
jgi:response regulator RpfG family c-di-GMP phosphodiesterase